MVIKVTTFVVQGILNIPCSYSSICFSLPPVVIRWIWWKISWWPYNK